MKLIKFIVIIITLQAVCLPGISAQEINARVINGTTSFENTWPFMVSLSLSGETVQKSHFCGGVLITNKHVLTAAHCVYDLASTPEAVQITGGINKLSSASNITVSNGIVIHPEYSPETAKNDLAVIHLMDELNFSTIEPVNSNDSDFWKDGSMATVLGWGATDSYFPVRPDSLQQGEIPVIADQTCADRHGIDFDSNTMFCAGKLASSAITNDGVDSCYGDSGGPLIVNTPNGFKVAGLVSWGLTCGSEKYWGIYTRVANYYDWIMSLPGVAPYNKSAPYIKGRPEDKGKLTCDKGEWGASDSATYYYEWHDEFEGIIKTSASPVYKLKRNDIGRNIRCVVVAENQFGSNYSESEQTGPIFASNRTLALSAGAKKVFKAMSFICKGNNCNLLVTLKNSSATHVSALLSQSGTAREVQKNASVKQATQDSWIINVRNFKSRNLLAFIRLVYNNKPSKMIEISLKT